MIFTATKRDQSRAGRRLSINRYAFWALVLAALLAVGLFGTAMAQDNTTLILDVKGVTPSNADTWLSLSLSGRFDVSVNGNVIGRVTANPTAEQTAAGETDTIAIPAGGENSVTLTPVAEDFSDGFVCEGTIPMSLKPGEANRKTVFAYARRGLFSLADVSAKDGSPLGTAEFVVLDAQGVMQWSFATDQNGAYTATRALPNGQYQLVQMRAPEGTMLLDQPTVFTVDTYFGSVNSITAVKVQNEPAPTGNATTGNLAVTSTGLITGDGPTTATLQIEGLCAGDNTVPLTGYTVTLNPAKLYDQGGNALSADETLFVDTLTVNPTQGSCSVQPLDADGQPVGAALACQPGEPVTLDHAAGAAITYLDATGNKTLPVGFTAGNVQATLRYEAATLSSAEHAAATVRMVAGVSYQYQYAGTDGISMVSADASIAPQTVTMDVPDGRTELTVTASVEALADGTLVIGLAPGAQTWTGDPITMAATLPEGARVLDSALPDGVQVIRSALQDTVVFDSTQWTAGTVKIPVAAGNVSALTLWALDPRTQPVTADAPEGYAIKAATHELQPMLDALSGISDGRYARTDVTLPSAIATGKTPGALTLLLSGTVSEQADQPTSSAANLGVTLAGANAKVVYGALTDGNGAFALSGDAAATTGMLRIALPANTMSVATRESGAFTMENVTLPQSGLNVTFVKMSGINGQIATAEGKPIANASLTLAQNGQAVQTAQTDANGAFALSGLEAGDYSLQIAMPADSGATLPAQAGLTAQADGTYTIDRLSLAYGEEHSLSLTATLLCAVRGTVTESGAGAAGLTVTLTDAGGASQTAQTDAQGAYAFETLPAGDYQLGLQLPANKAIVTDNGQEVKGIGSYTETLTLAEGEAKNNQLAMEATGSITGQIEALGEGQDISAASVNAQLSAKTDKDGSFTFSGLIGSDYTVYAPLPEGKTLLETSQWKVSERGDMIWITLSVTPGDVCALPAVEFVAMTGIEGVAYMDDNADLGYAEGEQLMSGVTVALQRKDGESWTDVANQTTDAYGHYAFQNLQGGVYRVVSQGSDSFQVAAVGSTATAVGEDALGVKASKNLTLKNGDMLNGDSNIALSQPASLKFGAFVDSNEDGERGIYERSIAGVRVEAVPAANPEGEAVGDAITDQNGEATLETLAPGSYVLRFTLPDGYLFTVNSGKWGVGYSCADGSDGASALSDPITLTAGQKAEAGVGAIPVGSFAGTVWSDLNNNGVLDEGEPGVPNVKLTLSGVRTGITQELTTDETGAYRFTLLRNDTYNFTANIPDNMLFARYTQTGGDSRSVFTTEGTKATRQFIVTDAQDVANKNVGIVEKASLAGIAFLDSNYNGIYDEGEPPYAGVTVEVVKNSNDHSMGKAVTGEDGTYTFDSLRGGDYRLRAILPNDGSIFTVVPAQTTGLVNLFAAREGRRENTVASLTVENGKTTQTCVGVAMGGTISGTVFLDAKYDGARNDSDKKASGVKIQLVAADGTLAATATTNANGNYTLEGIMPGEYTVRVQRRENYAFTRYRPEEENGNHVKVLAKDGYGETEAMQVAMGQKIEHINAGMLLSSTVTGIFFDDLNDNGLMDAGETGYTDGSVRLLSADGELDLTESVQEDGTYFFDGVMPGEYTITYLLPENAAMAQVAEGGNTVKAQGKENTVTGFKVESGKAYSAPLAGAVTLGSFAGYAYHDQNGNGVRDEGEEALSGVAITLTPSKTNLEKSETTTDSDGQYAITDLRPDQYSLTISLPDGYIFSGNLKDSGLTLDTAQQDTLTCPWAALTNRVQNAVGAVKPATIRASVWLDENRDGQHTSEERLLSDLTYELYDEAAGKVVKTAKSDSDGYVTFQDVRPATYTVRFAIPDQAQPAEDENSTFEAQGAMMSHSGILIAEGETFEDISGGLVSYTSIGGTVALDENGARTPQAAVEVTLYQSDSTEALQTTKTDEKGEYRFDGLWPDMYRLEVGLPTGMVFVKPDDPNYQAGDSVVTKTEDGQGVSDPFTLEMAHHLLTQNVIMIKPARVGDQVWLDVNGNGLRDADEPSLNGVTVELMQNGKAVYTATSNEWGYYEIADVYPGTYTLEATAYPELDITKAVPTLRIISSCLVQGDGNRASSDAFDVVSGSENFNMDLGYVLREGQTMPAAVSAGSVQNWTTAAPTPTP